MMPSKAGWDGTTLQITSSGPLIQTRVHTMGTAINSSITILIYNTPTIRLSENFPMNSPIIAATKEDRTISASMSHTFCQDSQKQIMAVTMEDKLPQRKPTTTFCKIYWLGVMGRTSLTKATPSSFSEMMFMALKVHPINIATISTMGMKISWILPKMSGRSRFWTSTRPDSSRCV